MGSGWIEMREILSVMVAVFIAGCITQVVADRRPDYPDYPDRRSWVCRKIDCPTYRTVHEGVGFEVRQYDPATWLVTPPLMTLSFESATLIGLRPILEYMQGQNLNWSIVPMTAPLLTSVVPGLGPFYSSAYQVQFLVPKCMAGNPPIPLEDSGLAVNRWSSRRCVIAKKFGGFAKDRNVMAEAGKLAACLAGTNWEPVLDLVRAKGEAAYSVAQYDPPFEIFQRTNEVWVEFAAMDAEDEDSECLPNLEPPPTPPPEPSVASESFDESNLLQLKFR